MPLILDDFIYPVIWSSVLTIPTSSFVGYLFESEISKLYTFILLAKILFLMNVTKFFLPSDEIEKDENGNCKYMGYVIEFGKCKIYHSGDTLWFDRMIDILKPFEVDVALLPINGNDPARGVAGNLNCKEAAHLAKAINAQCVIPCHYNMFTFNTADVNEFAQEAGQINQPYKILLGGGRFEKNIS